MKALGLVMLIVVFSTAGIAQTSTSQSAPSGVIMHEPQWQATFVEVQTPFIAEESNSPVHSRRSAINTNDSGNTKNDDIERLSRSNSRTKWAKVFNGYRASIRIDNTGPKAIKAIRWNFLLVDTQTGKIVKQYHFRSKKNVASGDTTFLSKIVGGLRQDAPPGKPQAVINRIEYADGSVWQHP